MSGFGFMSEGCAEVHIKMDECAEIKRIGRDVTGYKDKQDIKIVYGFLKYDRSEKLWHGSMARSEYTWKMFNGRKGDTKEAVQCIMEQTGIKECKDSSRLRASGPSRSDFK